MFGPLLQDSDKLFLPHNGLGLRVAKADSTGSYSYVCDGTTPGSPVLSDGHTTFTAGLSSTVAGLTLFRHGEWARRRGVGRSQPRRECCKESSLGLIWRDVLFATDRKTSCAARCMDRMAWPRSKIWLQ